MSPSVHLEPYLVKLDGSFIAYGGIRGLLFPTQTRSFQHAQVGRDSGQ